MQQICWYARKHDWNVPTCIGKIKKMCFVCSQARNKPADGVGHVNQKGSTGQKAPLAGGQKVAPGAKNATKSAQKPSAQKGQVKVTPKAASVKTGKNKKKGHKQQYDLLVTINLVSKKVNFILLYKLLKMTRGIFLKIGRKLISTKLPSFFPKFGKRKSLTIRLVHFSKYLNFLKLLLMKFSQFWAIFFIDNKSRKIWGEFPNKSITIVKFNIF